MIKWTPRKKIIFSIFIFLILISIAFSGQFTEYQGHFYFKPLTKPQPPYYPGSYENYSIYGSPFPWNSNATGYLNVSSYSNITLLKIHVKYSVYSYPKIFYDNRTLEIENIQGKFYYNGSPIILPFFYLGGNVISGYGKNYSNATISESMITPPGIYQYHIGIYADNQSDQYIFDAENKMLFGLEGLDPVINNVLGVEILDNNKTYPVPVTMILNSTNYMIFPVNWLYVVLVYVVVGFFMGWFIIVPVIILLVIASYRKKRENNGRHR